MFRGKFRRGWQRHWTKAFAETPEQSTDILVFGFPSRDAHSILLHAIAAHEFGHELINRFAQTLDNMVESAITAIIPKFYDELVEAVSEEAKGRGDDEYESSRKRLREDLKVISLCWVQEIFCDLLATRLVGPALLAAMDRILLGIEPPSWTHPPDWLRRNVVKNYVGKVLPHVLEDTVWRPLFGETGAESFRDIRYTIADKVCRAVQNGTEALLEELPCPLKDRELLAALVDEMTVQIEELCPPSVSIEQAICSDAFWVVMYTAWRFRFDEKRFSAFMMKHGWKRERDAESALDNLTLHALRALELRARWQKLHPLQEAANATQ